jgi:ribosome-associated heat shock protein Hsp15
MEVRIDKWLWAVRVFKTRSRASEACRGGRVLIDGLAVKPSRSIKPDEVVEVKQKPIIRRYRVKGLSSKRVSAKLAVELVEEITPVEELEKLKRYWQDPLGFILAKREKGTGRPTKKERRDLEKLRNKG